MKTTLAIVLAAAVLISGASVSLMSGAALAQVSSAASTQLWCQKGCPPPPKPVPTHPRGR
jgi:hypothetical protein